MIEEDYVSFEVAKLMKEKGFNERTNMPYVDDYQRLVCYIPTLQMAMKWLREVHNYNIEIDTIGRKSLNTLSWRSVIYNLEHDIECYHEESFNSYEEAAEAAIRYCLENLI